MRGDVGDGRSAASRLDKMGAARLTLSSQTRVVRVSPRSAVLQMTWGAEPVCHLAGCQVRIVEQQRDERRLARAQRSRGAAQAARRDPVASASLDRQR
jgi:hypothetical protein